VSAEPPPHPGALKLIRARLTDAGMTDARLIRWLKDRGAIPAGTRGLQCISTRRLEIIVEQWSEILPQLLP
jgi:hypothetical protein